MITQAIMARMDQESKAKSLNTGRFTVTSLSPCPYEMYLKFHHLCTPRSFSAETMVRLNDGKYQEEEMVDLLRASGFQLFNVLRDQETVHVGKANIVGHPDGNIRVANSIDGLEIKAMDLRRYTYAKQQGLERKIKMQVQCYMHSQEWQSRGIKKTWIVIKHKDTCRPFDIEEPYDPDYVAPLIEMLDRIVLENWEPKKERTDMCLNCDLNADCWPEIMAVDMSRVDVADLPELVEKWKVGKAYELSGKILVDEAREKFAEVLGDKDEVYIQDLKVQTIQAKRSEIPISKFVEIFGPDKLPLVLKEKAYSQMKVSEVSF